VDVQISIVGDDRLEGLESLSDWLRGEPDLAGRVRPVGTTPSPGELGSAMDALTVALGSGGALSVLATSLKVWLSQPRRTNLRLRINNADGASVELDVDRIAAGKLEGVLREALRGAEGEAGRGRGASA